MSTARRPVASYRGGLVIALGIAATAVAVGAVIIFGATSNELGSALIVTAVLVAVSVPMIRRQAEREQDRSLVRFLLLALILKLGAAVLAYFVVYGIYGGVADAAGYHVRGVRIAENFRAGIFDTGLATLFGTDFIRFLTGLIYALIGPTQLGGFLVFSWLGFLGLFFFYRAFTMAVPEGRARTYARLVFFLPSLVYWSSIIGKDAWMIFSLGIAALGAARLMAGRTWRGMAVAALGLWLATLVRPHVAGLIAIALVAGYLFRRSPERSGPSFAGPAKVGALAVLSILAYFVLGRTEEYLRQSDIRTSGGVAAVLEETTERTSIGGSRFTPSVLQSPARAPLAVVTVLFRPFVPEAHNVQTLAAAAEGTLILGLCLARFRWILAALRSVRRQPYVAFSFAYVGLFIVAFSAIANFGLLARERIQVLPLLLVLISVPAVKRRDELDARRP